MDYEGKFFPDEPNENESKKVRITKKIFKYLFYGAVAAVYIACFAALLSGCESKLWKKVSLSDEANEVYLADKKGFELYKINPADFMNYDGSIEIAGVVYSPTVNEFELGIKFNKKLATVSSDSADADVSSENEYTDFPFEYTISDNAGNTYTLSARESDSKGRYRYERLRFDGIKIDLDNNSYVNYKYNSSIESDTSEPLVFGDNTSNFYESTDPEENFKLTLKIYNPVTDTTSEFVVYTDNTVTRLTEFKD